jgi:RHS repeat-associated protein
MTDEYEYDAYGNSFTKSGTTPNNYLYRGEQYDSDLGLYYLRARYYNAGTGRFMSRDPEAGTRYMPRTLHKYLYAGGDPINITDPTGRAIAETPPLWFVVVTAVVVSALIWEPVLDAVLECEGDAVAKAAKSYTPVIRPFSGLPCAFQGEGPPHDDWPPMMPPDRQPPPRWPQPWERGGEGEAP